MGIPGDELAPKQTALNLALSTWFIMYLHGERVGYGPGGLPADFLSWGSSSLLIFDRVVCDEEALKCERRSEHLLSSTLLLELEKVGVLKPVNMREHFTQEFDQHLRDSGLRQKALEVMVSELDTIKRRDIPPGKLRLPEFLTWLNHYMFMGLDVPASLRYEWQEHHFKVPAAHVPALPAEGPKRTPRRVTPRHDDVMSIVKPLLPEFLLLPPVPEKTEGAAALRHNVNREKPALYRWIYGDSEMPRDRFHDFRMSPEFKRFDARVDEPRRAQTWRNFNVLMKTRARTEDVRAGLRKIVQDVVEGRRTVDDVKDELVEHQQELASHLSSRRTVTMDVTLTSVKFAVAVCSLLLSLAGGSPVLAPAGIGLGGLGVWDALSKRRKYTKLRREYPLAWLLRDFKAVEVADRRKMTPRVKR